MKSLNSVMFLLFILIISTAHGQEKLANKAAVITAAQKKSLVTILDSIADNYGFRPQSKFLVKIDSADIKKVSRIIDKYGWLGVDKVGPKGNFTLFMVILNADLETQLKYLPLLRSAVKQGKVHPSHLAVLEDRTAVRRGLNQIYGSQVIQDMKTGKSYLLPMQDPENVDKRRAKVGMPPMKEFVSSYGISWSVDQYYKDLKKFRIINVGQYEFFE